GEPARIIGEIAREQNVDVVVMATHGKGGLARLILGSVATGTLRHTTAPMLLVRPMTPPQLGATGRGGSESGSRHPYPPLAAGEAVGPTVEVHLPAVELELVQHGLTALAYAPGYDYGHVLAARALADRLRSDVQAPRGEPIAAR